MLFLRIIGIFCLFISTLQAANVDQYKKSPSKRAEVTIYRNFWHPLYHGQRLDYCTKDGQECGLSVARRYCKAMGYAYASQEIMAPNIGLTRYLNAFEQCKGWRCNGFMVIGCAGHLTHKPPKPYHYREKQFVYPRMNHFRIDWCYKPKQGCGKRAADSFCKRLGFAKATRFRRDALIDATKTVGNQALCFGKLCSGFKEIVCYR